MFLEFEATPDSIRESDETITFGFETAVYHDDSTAPTVRNEMSSTVTLQNDDFERPVLEFVHCERDHSTDPCELDENGGSVEVRAALPVVAPAPMWLSLDLLPDTSRVYSPAVAGDARLSSASLHIPKGSKRSNKVTVTAVDNDVWTDGHKQMSVQARVHSTLPMGAGTVTGIGFNIVEDDTKVLLISPDTLPKTPGNPKATGPVVLSEGGEGFWSEIRLSSRPSDTLRLTPAALPAGNGFSDEFTVRNAAGQTGSDATLTWTKPNDENDDPDWWRTVRRLEVIPPTDADDTDAYDSQARVHLTARIRARLTVGSVTHNAATLTLTGRTGSWWLKRTAPTAGACTAMASGVYTHNLTGLGDERVYAYTAYTDSACTTAVDTAAFTTLGDDHLTASSVTHDTATLTLTNGRGVWGLKRTAPSPAGACTAKASGVYTHNLTGLDASTAYTYTAYTDSACTTAIGTADFTTPAGTLTVGSVTHNAATLTLTGRTGAWGLKRTAPSPAGACTAMASGVYTHNLTGLDASTAYTYTFYTDSACTTAIGSHAATFATTTTAGAQYDDMWQTAVISAVERDNDARLVVGGPDGWGNSLTVTEGAVDADNNPEPVSYTLKLSGRPSAAANDNEQVPILVSLDTASAGSSDASLTLESGKCDDSGADARVTSKEVYFTQANWNTAQTVNVYACEDDDIRSAQVSVTHTVLEKQRSGGRVTILDTNAAWTRLNGLTGSWAEQALPGVDIGVIDNDGTLITLELQDANGDAINAISENGGVATVVAKLAETVTGRCHRSGAHPGAGEHDLLGLHREGQHADDPRRGHRQHHGHHHGDDHRTRRRHRRPAQSGAGDGHGVLVERGDRPGGGAADTDRRRHRRPHRHARYAHRRRGRHQNLHCAARQPARRRCGRRPCRPHRPHIGHRSVAAAADLHQSRLGHAPDCDGRRRGGRRSRRHHRHRAVPCGAAVRAVVLLRLRRTRPGPPRGPRQRSA